MVERGVNQRHNLDEEIFKDEVAAPTLDSIMQMEQARACYTANQARGGELSRLETAIVAFRTAVGRRLGALDLCPTAGPSGVLSGYLRFLSRQAVSRAQDTAEALLDEELQQYQCWQFFAEKDCSRLLSILTELLRSDTRLLKVIMCITIGNDLVLQCARAQAGSAHSGAGNTRDLDQRIKAALDSRIVTGELQATATHVLTEAFASDRENPSNEQLRSAVARGCEDAATLEATVHLERNAWSALQNLPVSSWKEALEGAFRASPTLLRQPVKDTVAEISPKVILALLHGGSEQVGPVGLLESALREDAGRRVLSSVVAPLITAHLPERAQLHLEGEAGRAAQVEGVVCQVTQAALTEASSKVESLKAAIEGDMSTIHNTLIGAVTGELPKLLLTDVAKQTTLDAARAETPASAKQADKWPAQEAAAPRVETQAPRENRGPTTPPMPPPRPGANIPSLSPATSLRPTVPPAGSQASGGRLVAPPSVPSTPLGYGRGFSSVKRPGSDRGALSQGVKRVATRGTSVAVAAPSLRSLPAATQASPDAAREAEASMDVAEDTSVAAIPSEMAPPSSSSTPRAFPNAADSPQSLGPTVAVPGCGAPGPVAPGHRLQPAGYRPRHSLSLGVSLGTIPGPPIGYHVGTGTSALTSTVPPPQDYAGIGRPSRPSSRDRGDSGGTPHAPQQRSQRANTRRPHTSPAGMEGNEDDGNDETHNRDEDDEDEDGGDPGALDRSGGSRRGSSYQRNQRQHLNRIRDENGVEWAWFQEEHSHLHDGRIHLCAGRKSTISDSSYLDAWAYCRALDDELVLAARAGWRQMEIRERWNITAWFPTLESGPALHWLMSGWWERKRQKEHPIIPVDCVDDLSYTQSPFCKSLLLPALEEYEGGSLQRLRNTMVAAAWDRTQCWTEGDRPREYLFVTLVYDRPMTGASAGLEPFHGPSTTRALNSVYFCAWCDGPSGSTTNAETYNAHIRSHLGLALVCGQCLSFTVARQQQDKFPDHFANKCPQRHQFRS